MDISVNGYTIPKDTLTLMESIAREIDDYTTLHCADVTGDKKFNVEVDSLNKLGKAWANLLTSVLNCEKPLAFKIAAAIIYNSSQASMGRGTAFLTKIGTKTDDIIETYQNSLCIKTGIEESIVIQRSEFTVSVSDTKADIRVSESGVEYVLPRLQEIPDTNIWEKSKKYLECSIDFKGFAKLDTVMPH
ncbi:TPA: hypothetical protein PXM28_004023 [Yersinia enterocolitica]|nr:hypothetical protein [Yersinia enterocolitica]